MSTLLRYPAVPEVWGTWKEHSRKIADALNGALEGRTNNYLRVTLRPDETTTVVPWILVRRQSTAYLTARSASAAAAPVWYSIETGKVTLHHDAQPDTDREFSMLLVG